MKSFVSSILSICHRWQQNEILSPSDLLVILLLATIHLMAGCLKGCPSWDLLSIINDLNVILNPLELNYR